MVLKIGKKEYKIKYAYEPVLKGRIISRFAKIASGLNQDDNENDNSSKIEDMLLFLPELLLVGLQKCHKDEFGYNYDTNENKDEQLNKAFTLVEEYAEDESSDLMKLFTDLQDELLENGFLSSLFRKEQNQIESVEKAVSKEN